MMIPLMVDLNETVIDNLNVFLLLLRNFASFDILLLHLKLKLYLILNNNYVRRVLNQNNNLMFFLSMKAGSEEI